MTFDLKSFNSSKKMYNSIPITLTVESQLPDNKGQVVICNAKGGDRASDIIEQICNLMGIEIKPQHFIKFEKGLIIHGKDILGQALGSKTVHHYMVVLDSHYVSRLLQFASVFGLLLGVSAIIAGSVLFTHEKTSVLKHPNWEYGIVADGGSSHTSFLIYNWPKNHMESVEQIGECTAQNGGIDQFASNPIGIKSYLSFCIEALKSNLTSMGLEDLSNARIYLGATAGMRLVNTSNYDNATLVMNYIEELFTDSPFYYVKGDAKILTGQEEGAFSWITTNILAGTLNNTDAQTSTTFGSLDMGGASMQISYECLEGSCPDNMTFELYDQKFEVFSKSDLCYGLHEGMKRFVVSRIYEAYLANGRNITSEFNNPCITRGNLLRDDWLVIFPSLKGEIFDTSCTTDLTDDEFAKAVKALPSDYQFFHRRASKGASDCYNAISFFTDPATCSSLFAGGNCLSSEPEEVMMMPDLPAYFAMSSYYWEFFRYMNTTSSNVTYEFAQKRIEELCSPDFIRPEDSFYSVTDCFESAYVFDIITKGYQNFDESNFNTIFFALDINGAEVSWALGFLVNEITKAALMEHEYLERLISTEILVILLGFGLFVSLLSALSLKRISSKRSSFQMMIPPTEN